jgi:hypothetical protein
MPAPPKIDYVMCPDGSIAIDDNCGSTMPLAQQEAIAYAKIMSDPVFQVAMESEKRNMMVQDEPKVETILGNDLTNTQKWAWVIGLTLAAWGLIYWSEKQTNK